MRLWIDKRPCIGWQKQLMYEAEWLPPGFIDDEWRKLQKQRIICRLT